MLQRRSSKRRRPGNPRLSGVFPSGAIGLVGFIVWGHHMFTSGYAPALRLWFMLSTLLVAVPTGVKFFSWLGTMWGGKLTFPTPMLFVLGSISVFLLGGLSGPANTSRSVHWNLHVFPIIYSNLPFHQHHQPPSPAIKTSHHPLPLVEVCKFPDLELYSIILSIVS